MMLSRILIISFFILLYCPQVFSTIEITGVIGASRYNEEENVIWAGLGGTNPGTCTTETCNNCLGGGSNEVPQACNNNRINPNGNLTINFTSDSASGFPIITDSNKQAIGRTTTNILPVSANTVTSVSIPWSTLCSQSNGNNGNCENIGSTQIPLYIGIDSSNDDGRSDGSLNDSGDDSLRIVIEFRSQLPEEARISTFSLFPGDEKVVMLTPDDEGEGELLGNKTDDVAPIEFPDGFPSYGNTRITHIRFYYEEVPEGEDSCGYMSQITNQSLHIETEVIDIGDNSSFIELSNLYFTGFQNYSTYVFKIALVDEAGNIGLFYNGSCDPEGHVITPTPVDGLLPGCFIATAAYGRSHKILEIFYQFRDQKLLPYTLGKIVHDLYYTYSPPLANIIRDNVFLKYIARILLVPFWIYAFLALQIGHILTFLLLASFISILIYFFMKKNVII